MLALCRKAERRGVAPAGSGEESPGGFAGGVNPWREKAELRERWGYFTRETYCRPTFDRIYFACQIENK